MRNCDTASTSFSVLSGNRRRCRHLDCIERDPMTRKQAEAHHNFHNKDQQSKVVVETSKKVKSVSATKLELLPVGEVLRYFGGGGKWQVKCPKCWLRTYPPVEREVLEEQAKGSFRCISCGQMFRVEL